MEQQSLLQVWDALLEEAFQWKSVCGSLTRVFGNSHRIRWIDQSAARFLDTRIHVTWKVPIDPAVSIFHSTSTKVFQKSQVLDSGWCKSYVIGLTVIVNAAIRNIAVASSTPVLRSATDLLVHAKPKALHMVNSWVAICLYDSVSNNF